MTDASFDSLGKCCAEVSKSLEDIFRLGNKSRNEGESIGQMTDGEPVMNNSISIDATVPNRPIEDSSQDGMSLDQSDTSNRLPKKAPDPRRRRSSLGSLAQFVRRNSAEATMPSDSSLGANEAMQRFQFRSLVKEPALKHVQKEKRKNMP